MIYSIYKPRSDFKINTQKRKSTIKIWNPSFSASLSVFFWQRMKPLKLVSSPPIVRPPSRLIDDTQPKLFYSIRFSIRFVAIIRIDAAWSCILLNRCNKQNRYIYAGVRAPTTPKWIIISEKKTPCVCVGVCVSLATHKTNFVNDSCIHQLCRYLIQRN